MDSLPNYFDIHSHLQFSQFDSDRDIIISKMRDEKVWTITVGTDKETSEAGVNLSNQNYGIWATVGIHPTDLEEKFDENFFDKLIDNTNVIAIGECGLDYFRIDDQNTKENQKKLFEQHITIAAKHDLPLMLHMRPSNGTMDAYKDGVEILKSYFSNHRPLKCNAHFFVGNLEIAKQFLEMGIMLSFDGPITFAREYDEVIRYAPLGMIMAETDAPFAAPVPFRGKRREPLYVKEIVNAIAKIKGKDTETVRKATVENALRTFNIEKSA